MPSLKKFFIRYKTQLYLALIAAFGFGLRSIYIGGIQPYGGDEVLSLAITRHFGSIRDLIHYLSDVEFHPPFFYMMLRVWTNWFGTSHVATRMLSNIFGTATILVTYFLCQKLFANRKISLLASFFIAVLPLQVEFSQIARPYTIMCFLAGLAFICIWQYFETKKLAYLAGYVFIGILGLYTHYSFFLVIAATSSWSLFQVYRADAQKISRQFIIWLASHALILLGFSFWLKNLLFKIALSDQVLYELPRSTITSRPSDFFELLFNSLIWVEKAKILTQLNIVVLLFAKLMLLGLFIYGISLAIKRNDKKELQPLIFLGWMILIPMIVFLFTPFSFEYTQIIAEHMIFTTVALMIFISWLLTQITSTKKFMVLLLVLMLSLVPSLSDVLGNDGQNDSDYQLERMAQFINDKYKPGDVVVLSQVFSRADLQYFLRPEIPVTAIRPISYFGGDSWSSPSTLSFFENEAQTRIFSVDQQSFDYKMFMINHIYKPKRIWLLFVTNNDYLVHNWFSERKWVREYGSISNIFLVDIYRSPEFPVAPKK